VAVEVGVAVDVEVDVDVDSSGWVLDVGEPDVGSTETGSPAQDAPNTSNADAVSARARFAVRCVSVVFMVVLS
jgi:hypothetical protein